MRRMCAPAGNTRFEAKLCKQEAISDFFGTWMRKLRRITLATLINAGARWSPAPPVEGNTTIETPQRAAEVVGSRVRLEPV